jgi:hypothetical protein
MFNVISHQFKEIEHIQNKNLVVLYVIVSSHFYQAHPINDRWTFESLDDSINALAPKFWKIMLKCYELIIVMQ